ncbi:polyprenyl synthetase family protein [Shouchella clausii]|uniref:Farnesyl diphosphate synthase n=2 Tax=Shouchella TaxID=2893057 RepID=Q5WF62_SHOC1|nr:MULTISPECIES: farnesyl diphosphate synthase [Shouchella]ALA54632.1 (2E,6E)-farnesyl diphosphate synthase [Shouchella clausii]MCM3379907.1 polyprenyl synthetase family protein [Shouchella rhizosphaerae]MDO7267451.1 polyprenyl synthetase family protein [Shouchella clausii]MDO7287595.1 polyprenyl synthetase family protein [Shouchella clausii]MDP0465670.1 polyprenyl synthetase family protein [Shouchella rhizosphaerae]
MSALFQTFLEEARQLVDKKLPEYVRELEAEHRLKEAMLYSLEAGGKRVRPVLLLAVLEAYNQPILHGLDTACAIEMVHTYSLVHDDLPAMDDDDLRRGQPTNHKVFGEATAILAGDALLTQSFALIANADAPLSAKTKVSIIAALSKAAGASGMVGGQLADMFAEGKQLTVEQLANVHKRKTGELLAFSIEAGALIAGVSNEERSKLNEFGQEIGLLFQIKDDILDVEGDSIAIGKPVGSDAVNNKSTYPGLLGLDGAKTMLHTHYDRALQVLDELHLRGTLLEDLAKYIVTRDH